MGIFLSATILVSGCGYFQKAADTEIEPEPVSAIPFSQKLPEKFKADVLIKTDGAAGTFEMKYFVARNGIQKLERFRVGKKNEFALLTTADNKSFRLTPADKKFVELERGKIGAQDDSLSKSITSRWLNEKKSASFKDLGVADGLRKFEVTIEDSINSLVYIYIDEKLNFPVKQEFYIVDGKNRKLTYVYELRNISLTPEAGLFAVPGDYSAGESD
jgi:hypothetical protein